MMQKHLENSVSFIKELGADQFKPFAYYDKHLDCIRVRIKDCSVVEERLSRIFTILKAAHPIEGGGDLLVGFNIKGVRYLFEQVGLPHEGVFKLADIIGEIVKVYPDTFVKKVREEFIAILEDNEISVKVDMDKAA